MISCIICSRQSDISEELKENIQKTIGCEYELIIIDNSTNTHSIFSAYNKGVTLSKGDILCFMHEDIIYHTSNWGFEVIKYFEGYENVGLIGVAGTHYLPNNPFAQWDSELSSSHLIQGSYVNGTYRVNEILEDESTKRPTQVVAVDGMWMCIKRDLFNNINWDENIFSGFHAYDSDISLQILNVGKEVHIIWNILIEHKSIGYEDQKFYENSILLYNKWKNNLPILKGVELSEKLIRLYDSLCYTKYMYRKSTYEYQKTLISKSYKIGKFISNHYNKLKKWGGVDILLITYNQERYVTKALESIIMQQVEDDIEVRVIIADDCSTDRTLDIIKSYESKSPFQFVYLDSSKNLGIAQNYRRAYKSTVADYIAIIEGDDYWSDKRRIQKHIDYLSTHTECVMTKNNYLVYSNRNKEWSSEVAKNNIITLRQALIEYELANMSCCVFRGKLLRDMDEMVYEYGHQQMKEATDWYTHLYLLQFGYGYVFEDLMSVYRIDTGANVSRTVRSYDEIINKGKLCYELSLDLVGDNYKIECYNRYLEAVEICRKDKKNLLYQKYSDYIPPILASFLFYKLPIIWWNIKHTLRNLIPNKLYKRKIKM